MDQDDLPEPVIPGLISLRQGIHEGLEVIPRWPSRQIRVDETAWERLRTVQRGLPVSVRLIVTRGYEPRCTRLGIARALFRAMGVRLFTALYRTRGDEISDIFGGNGHDVDGTHVDVSIRLDGRRLRFLPLGVFTPGRVQTRRAAEFETTLLSVKNALLEKGFRIHKNPTESLQIHCDLAERNDRAKQPVA